MDTKEIEKEVLKNLISKMHAIMAEGGEDEEIKPSSMSDAIQEASEEASESKDENQEPETEEAETEEADEGGKEALKNFIKGKHTVPKSESVTVSVIGLKNPASGKKMPAKPFPKMKGFK
jgi:hypothetical protein